MPKEILIYGPIYSDLAKEVVTAMSEAGPDGIIVRVNTNGGSPEDCFAMITKFAEYSGSKEVVVDGMAYSMGASFCSFADKVRCFDISQFMFHRAAYPDWFEQDPDYFDETTRENLQNINSAMQKAFMAKIDVAALQVIMDSKPELNGAKVKDIFSMDQRIDLNLSAPEAKKIGLVDSIIKATPAKSAEIKSYLKAAISGQSPTKKSQENLIPENMTKDELKTKFPTVYNEIFKEGKVRGKSLERDRVGACLAFLDVDKKVVLETIKSGEKFTQTQMSEFALKAVNKTALGKLKDESQTEVETEEEEVEVEASEPGKKTFIKKNAAKVQEFADLVSKSIGLKNAIKA